MKLLRKITIRDYPTKIKISEARRAVYHRKGGKRPIPKRYQGKDYTLDKDGFVINKKTGERVLANPRTAGQPNYLPVNGQKYYNMSVHPMTRNKMMQALKEFFAKHLTALAPFTKFPLIIQGEMHRPLLENDKWDMDNIQAPYVKAFHDTMTDLNLIPDDLAKYVSGPVSFILTPSTEHKFVIRFYHDNRDIWEKYHE